MASLEERVNASRRRGSAVPIEGNPLESGISDQVQIKVENLADCDVISCSQLEGLLSKLKSVL